MIAYVDKHRDEYGVEPICEVLQFAPRTYYAAKARPPSTRAVRDEVVKPEIARVHRDNFGVYGVDKVWAQLNREGTRVARCTPQSEQRRVPQGLGSSDKAHEAGFQIRHPLALRSGQPSQ